MASRYRPLAPIALAVLVVACGGTATPTARSSEPAPTGAPTASPMTSGPSLTPLPGSSGDPTGSQAGVPTTTETDWGAIWDALPPSFPRDLSWAPVDPIEGPASGAFAIGASAEDVATQMQGALELANYSTFTMSGPFEDGSYVIESIGATEPCRVETRITPLSGVTHVRVRVSADCPFE